MRYSRLGGSGLVVSKLAFGTMTLGNTWAGPLAAIDAAGADTLVGSALEAGINFFDTADVYHGGESETLLGRALGERRSEAVIATKVGLRGSAKLLDAGLSARHIHRSIEASLRRMNTDWVDILICHRPDPLTPLEETLTALDAVVRSGKARYLGFSNWPAWLAAKAIAMQKAAGLPPFVTGQMYYSLIARDIEMDYVPMAADAGVGTMVWSPLSSGFLSGKYSPEDPEGQAGRLASMDLLPFDREQGHGIVDVLRDMAGARSVPVAAVALAWVLARPTITSAIIGFSSAQQFAANLQAVGVALSHEDMERLDAVSRLTLPYPHNFIARFAADPLVRAIEQGL